MGYGKDENFFFANECQNLMVDDFRNEIGCHIRNEPFFENMLEITAVGCFNQIGYLRNVIGYSVSLRQSLDIRLKRMKVAYKSRIQDA